MKILKFFKKIVLYSTIIFIVGCFSIYLYVENGAKIYFPEKQRTEIIKKIKSAPQLPENFIEFYSAVYPRNMKYSIWSYLKRQFLSYYPSREDKCLFLDVSKIFYFPSNKIQKSRNLIKPILLSAYIEDLSTQKECLNFEFQKFDFLYNRKGIDAVSQDLFKKPVKDLQPIEMAEIIALYENPLRNDRYSNPEMTQTRANVFLERYQEYILEHESTTSK